MRLVELVQTACKRACANIQRIWPCEEKPSNLASIPCQCSSNYSSRLHALPTMLLDTTDLELTLEAVAGPGQGSAAQGFDHRGTFGSAGIGSCGKLSRRVLLTSWNSHAATTVSCCLRLQVGLSFCPRTLARAQGGCPHCPGPRPCCALQRG